MFVCHPKYLKLLTGTVFLWLNDGPQKTWKEKLQAIRDNGLIIIHDEFQNAMATHNNCHGLIVRKDTLTKNLTATLTSWDCSKTKSFICYHDAYRFTTPQKLDKFPCIPQKETAGHRRKRSHGNAHNEWKGQHKKGKFGMMYFEFETQ